jgi:hypothetical protein
MVRWLWSALSLLVFVGVAAATDVRFLVTVGDGVLAQPQSGRVLVVLANRARPEPRLTIGDTGLDAPVLIGTDGNELAAGKEVQLDGTCLTFPIAQLRDLRPGQYLAQAVFDYNPDLRIPTAPGNLYSVPTPITIPEAGQVVAKLTLTKKIPDEQLPKETDFLKWRKFPSAKLSAFYGRPMFLRVGIWLPKARAADANRKFPVRVHIGGYGSRYTTLAHMALPGTASYAAWNDPGAPQFITLHLDGCGPLGDPYQVNSANHGPYGDAVVQELIPAIEKEFGGNGQRVTDGASTGGWVSLALQVFYPDAFKGCWSFVPDPVDFRHFELINIYDDQNAYVNKHGFERPAKRDVNGDTVYHVRHECQVERVLGRGNRWELSGKDWGAWNATYGPRGADGRPVPLWDGASGVLNRGGVEHWRKYDLRHVLETNWATLGPKLAGKLHVFAGEADDYFLNNAVHRLDAFLRKAQPPAGAQIIFGPRGTHGFTPLTTRQVLEAMHTAVTPGQP